jgi:hypothetical protein
VIQLVMYVALCLVAAFVLRQKPLATLVVGLALWFFVPTVGSYLLTGQRSGPLTFHAATWFILSAFVMQVMQEPRNLRRVVSQTPLFLITLGLVLAVAVFTTRTVQGGGGMVLLIDQMLVPAVFFVLIIIASYSIENLVEKLRSVLLVFGCLVALLAILQYMTKSVLFYEAGFETQFWFNPATERWMGTFDQPLALSLVLCSIVPLAAHLRRLLVLVPFLIVVVAGVMVTQSRLGLVIVLGALAFTVGRSNFRLKVKVAIFSVLAAGVIALLNSPVGSGVLGRVADDTGSSEARGQAYAVFFRNWAQYFLSGSGMTSSYAVSAIAGLKTSFESSILMYAVDLGIVFAVLYFGALCVIVGRNAISHSIPGLTIAATLVVFIPQTYSGLATRSVAGIFVWTVLAMILVAGSSSTHRVPRRDVHGSDGPGVVDAEINGLRSIGQEQPSFRTRAHAKSWIGR